LGVVIFKGSDIIARQKMKLEDRCSNNQTELVAIHKALEEIELLNRERISPLTVIIYTDSQVSLDSLRNAKKPFIPHRGDEKTSSQSREKGMEDKIFLGQSPRWNTWQ